MCTIAWKPVHVPLVQSGLKKGDLPQFVEDAVLWRLMNLNITDVRARNTHLTPEEIEFAADQAPD